jgi:hypothetical protein
VSVSLIDQTMVQTMMTITTETLDNYKRLVLACLAPVYLPQGGHVFLVNTLHLLVSARPVYLCIPYQERMEREFVKLTLEVLEFPCAIRIVVEHSSEVLGSGAHDRVLLRNLAFNLVPVREAELERGSWRERLHVSDREGAGCVVQVAAILPTHSLRRLAEFP